VLDYKKGTLMFLLSWLVICLDLDKDALEDLEVSRFSKDSSMYGGPREHLEGKQLKCPNGVGTFCDAFSVQHETS
jgi:hypothetical protein